ncbi:carbamoyl phosphate synthase large subunit [Lactobacillus sp. ESL0791]|uniref:carbamoyl phosphate synthase large subunit n=1 Tax=Lactobacillus sp. ESL0791 TaxID=2983234 RepID=UPI0023F8E078|nr:carbamoyl phosphate synthase large subunit [Lactobacillus sp. ESL0791]MDF7638903.1 carbamoyl phosphate synthase large subunit [Lactobacillus sp. ESL0791]
MPLENDLDKILIIGSGPTLIGSVAETDLVTTDAIDALLEEDIQVVLVNPNPATISTDKRSGVTVYLEPMTLDFLKRIIRMEEPDAIMTAFGSTTGLKITYNLLQDGILQEMGIKLLTTNLQAIKMKDQRQRIAYLKKLNIDVNRFWQLDAASTALTPEQIDQQLAFPVLVTKFQAYYHNAQYVFTNSKSLSAFFKKERQTENFSWNHYQITEDLSSWEEVIVDVIRDKNGNVAFINFADSIEPVAINSGDSIMVMPALTLNNDQIQELRAISQKIVANLQVTGITSIRFAVKHHGTELHAKVLSIKARVTRSAIWAQRTGLYSIGYVVAKVAIGYNLNEISDPLSGLVAAIEPVQDKIALKMPYWSLATSRKNHYHLGRRKQSSGEAMGIGRNFETAFLKGLASTTNLDYAISVFTSENSKTKEEIKSDLLAPDEMHIVKILAAIAKGFDYQELQQIINLHPIYFQKLQNIVKLGQQLAADPAISTELLTEVKKRGFSNRLIAVITGRDVSSIRKQLEQVGLATSYTQIDGSAGLYRPKVHAVYSSYGVENEAQQLAAPQKILIIGMLPSQVSVTSEFDYMISHAIKALHKNNYATILLSNNDESVANRYKNVERIYFDPITIENICKIAKAESIKDVLLQFSGKEINALSEILMDQGLNVLGYQNKNINRKIDNILALPFKNLKLNPSLRTSNLVEIKNFIEDYDFPFLLGGISRGIKQKSAVVYDLPAVEKYLTENQLDQVSISHFIEGNKYELTAISDGKDVTVPGIIEHLEQSGSHASDSIAVFKPQNLTKIKQEEIKKAAIKIIKKIKMRGIFTLHFLTVADTLYLLQVKPYAGHNVAFLSQALGKDITEYTTEVLIGKNLSELGYINELWPTNDFIHVKMPVFSYIDYNSGNTFDSKMKSSGSVMGRDTQLAKALYKGYEASDLTIPSYGTLFISVRNEDKQKAAQLARRFYRLGYKIIATEGTANVFAEAGITTGVVSKVHDDPNNLIEKIRQHKIVMVINITSLSDIASSDAIRIRDEALNTHIPVFSSIETTELILEVLESLALTTQPV